ncbi:MAG: hypothetical protein HZA06_02410, partial [Nitrospirae bacterium]|nr:hypothetical protein [Nitrospirota bacterium]
MSNELKKVNKRLLMKGNEALAEAAIRAGCKCYFGYTQQPRNQTSIPKPLLHKLYGSRALK